jgi:hypothetical protein
MGKRREDGRRERICHTILSLRKQGFSDLTELMEGY